jgi:type I restriction enzyme S subunit
MKKGWQKTALGEAFTTVTGNTPPKNNPELFGDFMPLVKPPELLDAPLDSAEDGLSEAGSKVARIAPPNSILVSCIGNLGKVGLNTVPVAFNQQINAILPDETRAVPEFMVYQVLSCYFKDQLEALSSGTTVPIVNKSRFNSIEVVLPPLPEQQRIVALLDEAFAGLATAQAHAERNLRNARAIFESHLNAVFTQRGEGWVERKLGEICIVDWGNTDLTKKSYVEGGAFLAVSAAGCDGRIGHKEHSKHTPVLSAIGAQCGRMFLPDEDFTAIKNTITLTPREGLCTGRFLYRLLTHVELPKRGAAQPFIAKGDIQAFSVSMPESLSAQTEIEASLAGLHAETQRLTRLYEQKLAALAALKQSLLHQAFSGAL